MQVTIKVKEEDIVLLKDLPVGKLGVVHELLDDSLGAGKDNCQYGYGVYIKVSYFGLPSQLLNLNNQLLAEETSFIGKKVKVKILPIGTIVELSNE